MYSQNCVLLGCFFFCETFKVYGWSVGFLLILIQSVAPMLLILFPDLLLHSTLAVSYCLPLRTILAPLLSHTNTFSGLELATKFSQVSPKKLPPQHSVLHSSGLWRLNQRCCCRTAVRDLFSSNSCSSQVSRLHPQALSQQHYGESEGILDLLCDCSGLKVVQANRKCSRPSWVSSVSGGRRQTCQSLRCIRSRPDNTRDGTNMSAVTVVIRVGILFFHS